MNRFALLLSLLSFTATAQGTADTGTPPTTPAPAQPSTPAPAPPPTPEAPAESAAPPAREDDPCLSEDEDEGDSDVLAALRLSINGETRALAGVELQGLERLSQAQVRNLARVPARGTLSPEQAAIVLRRLARTGLFTRVTPTVRLAEGSTPVLVVVLEEQPYVTRVDLEGLREDELREVRDELFRLPPYSTNDDSDDDDDDEDDINVRIDTEHGRVEISTRKRTCPAPYPPRELLASFKKGELHPGFVWRGLPAALERGLDELHDEGYPLATIDAALTPDGVLTVRVDEGRVEAVEVSGVDEDVAEQVREVLGIKPGDVLLRSDLRRASRRLETEMPFLSLRDVETLPSEDTRFQEEREEGGARRYRLVPEEERRERKKHREEEEEELTWSELAKKWERASEDAITTVGRRVVVHVKPRGASFDVDLIPMHTQVTGFAPGLSGSVDLWDVRNRAHVKLDAALTIPLRWGGQRIPEDPEQTKLQRRLNWLVGAKAQVPVLRLAEIGIQLHDFTDTFDRWRLGAIDSFIYSALLNRPDAEYFRRSGLTGFATWRLGTQWLLGAEYRRDTYESLVSFSPPFSLFRRDSAPFHNPEVDEGKMTSVVGRLEYASDAARAEGVGSLFRSPELSLLRHDWEWPERSAVHSLLTVEVGSPELGGDDRFHFWKVVSDSVLYVNTGHDSGLRLRVRAAGGEDLPLQKREALGGWDGLRGFAFKEFRGDASLLASAEYRWGFLGAFADVGTVHRGEAGWMDPRLGVGAQLYFGDSVRFTAAWRTDERAALVPEARLLFVRTF
ncbi:hypothetical protein JRI60_42480 [Archangium violaceum]|uniref:hypothetical protein n=1 Tax=Archangium violaceum TaxID=83451 RepID=UPI001950FE9A|nr:hypothetical protein [Archangium violaceum]QRN95656.1 hypothetical protein JRI60_42480 [Archangium violaceum]